MSSHKHMHTHAHTHTHTHTHTQVMDPEVARAIVDGDHTEERGAEKELHAFLDTAAKEGHHRRRWIA